ncbi:MAG: hypothetical protein HKN68_20425 [Saprospiraceae bacterium]|nr:hypothetical protein [Saprospiraceae bacterium]
MKLCSILILIISMIFYSCNPKPDNKKESKSGSGTITLPDDFSYPGRHPQMGDPKNLQLVIEWNKRRSDLEYNIEGLVNDTGTIRLADGLEMVATRDSLTSYLRSQYVDLNDQEITVNAAIPIYYSDLNHEWVYSWIYQELTLRDNTESSSYFHEDFRIIDGKISMIYQFRRTP